MHPKQPPLDDELRDVWLAALEHAELEADQALLYVFDGSNSEDGWSGWHLPADRFVYEDARLPEVDDALREEMNSEEFISATKVLVWRDRKVEELAGTIRHELEHAKQQAAHGQQLVDLHGLAFDVVLVRVGGLPKSSLLYTVIPMELDANAAAASLVRDRYGAERVVELLNDDAVDGGVFRSNVGPGSVDDLPERMLAFLAAHRDLCERLAEAREEPFREMVERAWTGAGEVWDNLTGDPAKLPRE